MTFTITSLNDGRLAQFTLKIRETNTTIIPAVNDTSQHSNKSIRILRAREMMRN